MPKPLLQLLLAISLLLAQPQAQQLQQNQEITKKEDIFPAFYAAMTDLTPELKIDTSQIQWQYGPELDLKNIYCAVLAEYPQLKYTYDMEVSLSEAETCVQCRFLYMPYRVGAYTTTLPPGSHVVNSLYDAKVMAQSMIDGTERLHIAITDPTLAVEDIQLALAQAGYGWIRFDLSRDGTEIIASPPVGKTLKECVDAINASFQIAGEYLKNHITSGMSEEEKIKALYAAVTQNTAYDFRYYSDRNSMPFESTVALGALRDHLAICGGYAQAFETLLDMAGIENYTVTGISNGEQHLWNYVILNGKGYYCDPTIDRGGTARHFMMTAEELAESGRYLWDHDFLVRLSDSHIRK